MIRPTLFVRAGASDINPTPESNEEQNKLDNHDKHIRQIDTVVEEIKRRQILSEHRRQLQSLLASTASDEEKAKARMDLGMIEGSDTDETATLYVANLAPSTTESFMSTLFGAYGAILSIKILAECNCGFVAFAQQADAEKAKISLEGMDVFGMPLQIRWASQCSSDIDEDERDLEQRDVIHIRVPANECRRTQIDLLAKFVCDYGHPFEAYLLHYTRDDPEYAFLGDPDCAEYYYYRWRVFIEAHGQTIRKWRSENLKLFENGKTYVPPAAVYARPEILALWPESIVLDPCGAPPHLVGSGRQMLPPGEVEDLRWILQTIKRSKASIRDAMIFCVSKADCSIAITRILFGAILSPRYGADQKVAVLYLISDILHNTFSLGPSAWSYRTTFERQLPDVFDHLKTVGMQLPTAIYSLLAARVVSVLSAWHAWSIYPPEMLEGLEFHFFGLQDNLATALNNEAIAPLESFIISEDADGTPIEKEYLLNDLKSVPMWLRKDMMKWLKHRDDLPWLEKTSQAAGLSIGSNSTSDPAVFIRRLVHRAVYVALKQRQDLEFNQMYKYNKDVKPESKHTGASTLAATTTTPSPQATPVAPKAAVKQAPRLSFNKVALTVTLEDDLRRFRQLKSQDSQTADPPPKESSGEKEDSSKQPQTEKQISHVSSVDDDEDMFGLVDEDMGS